MPNCTVLSIGASIVDTRAVITGLKSGQIGALALDVYEEEADLFFEDLSQTVIHDDVFARLLTFPNVLITGHQGFFTREAMALIATRFEHLLFDGPSLDRADDGGKLTAHRVLWGARPRATVTELIFVPDAAVDGVYRLSLQLPAFVADAAPSRPLIQQDDA